MKKSMIISVGGTPEPIIKSIVNYEPDLVYFMPSQSSITQIGEITVKTKISPAQIKTKIVEDHQSLVSAFKTASEIIKEIKEDYEIWIDYTGGTKSMSAGLVIAGLNEGCKFVYVGAVTEEGRNKKGLGIVKDGFEDVLPQANPYELFAKPETDRAIDLFNRYQFAAALNNFDSALEKIRDEGEKERLRILRELTDAYSSWDKFKVLKIKTRKESIISILEKNMSELRKIYKISGEKEPDFVKQIEKNIEFLKLRFGDVRYVLADLINNVSRRIEEGKYDDAVARLYRAIELVAQTRLKELGLIDEKKLKDNRVFAIVLRDLEKQLDKETIEKYKKGQRQEDLKKGVIKIGLSKDYDLLADLDDELGKKFIEESKEAENLQNLLNNRNNSILAHGLEPVERETATELFEEVKAYAKTVLPELDELMKDASFPKL
jgi:CRISPR-associated protein (TIGR02710 family)